MLRADRKAYVTFALVALAGLAGITAADGRNLQARERYEHPHAAQQGRAARVEPGPRRPVRNHPGRTERYRTATRWQASAVRARRFANNRWPSREIANGDGIRVIRYRNTLTGTVERPIRPGLVNRTFVSGGRILYARVYQRHVWHRFGRTFTYETFVPAVRYPAVYYAWALAPLARPIVYRWSWGTQPWYAVYGGLFAPYPVYASPDLWMTDYILAQSMRSAYLAQAPVSASEPSSENAEDLAADSSVAAPDGEPVDQMPAPQTNDAPPPPQSAPLAQTPSSDDPTPADLNDAAAPSSPSDIPPAPVTAPPAVTPQVKAQLDAEIKVQMREQQTAATVPATLATQSTPPALRPAHVFFQVVQPLEVPSGTANAYCALSPNDYIRRIGGMSADDWMIPVVVELSGRSDCPEGLETRIGLNDLDAMENEQEAQVLEAMRAASEAMSPNGPPGGPGLHPALIADGRAAPDPSAVEAIRQVQ